MVTSNGANPLNTLLWEVKACSTNSDSDACQSIGVIHSRDPVNQCTNTLPEVIEMRGSNSDPNVLNRGYWTNQQTMPRQGWAFYWASDLRYANVHEEYGDTYDLFAYWSTYRYLYNRWTPIWLYAQLKQVEDDNTCTDGSGNSMPAFGGFLFYPQLSNNSREDLNVGDLRVCFDPDSNNDVTITINSSLDMGLDTSQLEGSV